jgi:hypothetical protein
MNIAVNLIAMARALAAALLADRWASPWLKALEKKGLDPDRFYVIAVVGSFAIAGLAIRHILL